MAPRWVRENQLSEHTNIPVKTLQRWRVTGGGPPFSKRNGVVLYDLARCDAWLEAGTRTSTSNGKEAVS